MRIMVVFSKGGSFRFAGNLDLHRAWMRLLTRAEIPVEFSQGFHPQPKISIAAPLPLGWVGEREVLEFWLAQPMTLDELFHRVRDCMPPGISLVELLEVKQNAPAIQTMVDSLEYRVILPKEIDNLGIQETINQLMDAVSIPRTRRGKLYDLRPLILEMSVVPNSSGPSANIDLILISNQNVTGRPDEVLDVLGIDPLTTLITRKRINLKSSYFD